MNLMRYKKAYLIFSLILLLPGLFSLLYWGLPLSIDFKGGSVITYSIKKDMFGTDMSRKELLSSIRGLYEKEGATVDSIVVSPIQDLLEVSVRVKDVSPDTVNTIKSVLEEDMSSLGLTQTSFQTVGPSIGKETTKKAFSSLFWVSMGILGYIAYAFRNIPKPYSGFRFGMSAIIAMLHDALMVLGAFSLLGHFKGIEVDSLFIPAILTVISFSVHDSIVVFDRIRENLNKLSRNLSFEFIVNYSAVETLNRSIAVSLTVVFTLTSLYLLGGESIKYFVLAMLIGTISGTYSSIFTASPLLILWEDYMRVKQYNHIKQKKSK